LKSLSHTVTFSLHFIFSCNLFIKNFFFPSFLFSFISIFNSSFSCLFFCFLISLSVCMPAFFPSFLPILFSFLQASLFKLSAFLLPFPLPSFYFFFCPAFFTGSYLINSSYLPLFCISFLSVPSLFPPWFLCTAFLTVFSCTAFLTGYWLFLFEVCSYFLPSIYPSSLPSTSPSPLI